MIEQRIIRDNALVTPLEFEHTTGTTSGAIYTVKADEHFLLRHVAVSNNSGVPVTLTLTVDGTSYVGAKSVAANTAEVIQSMSGLLLGPSAALAGLSSMAGLIVYGWGVRIEGGGNWQL